MKVALQLTLALCASAVSVAQDLTPDQILERAVEAQKGASFASYVPDFEVRLTMTDHHPEKGRINFDVDCKFKMPNRILTAVKEPDLSGKDFTEAFDGKVAWYRDDKGLRLYEGRDFVEDRQKLTDTASTMRQLLRFFFLSNLKKDMSDLKRLDDASYTDPRSGEVTHAYLVSGVGRRSGDDVDTDVKVWVEKETYRLMGVTITPLADPEGRVNFSFSYHRPNPQGVIVPGRIEIYHGSRSQPSQVIVLLTDGDHNDIRFNVGLKDELFSPPGEPAKRDDR